MTQLTLGAGVPLSVWEAKRKYYRDNQLPNGSMLDDLETIIRLACETGDRSDTEQNALLRQARRLDKERNACVTGNDYMWDNPGSTYAVTKRPLSDIESLVRDTWVQA